MERMFTVNIKYGKVLLNPKGIKKFLSEKTKKQKTEERVKVKTR